MKNLFNLLERFSKSLNKDSSTKEIIIKTLKEKTQTSLDAGNINLKNDILEISTSAVAKSEINLKENLILSELKDQGVFVVRIVFR